MFCCFKGHRSQEGEDIASEVSSVASDADEASDHDDPTTIAGEKSVSSILYRFDKNPQSKVAVTNIMPGQQQNPRGVVGTGSASTQETKQELRQWLEVVKRKEKKDMILIVLAKLMADESCAKELDEVSAQDPSSARFLLPFVINTLLYGFGHLENVAPRAGLTKEKEAPQQQLHAAALMTKRSEPEKDLEHWVYSQALKSVQFALRASWYLSASLLLGPTQLHYRTTTILMGLEAVVLTHNKVPAEIIENSMLQFTTSTTITATSSLNVDTHDIAPQLTTSVSNHNGVLVNRDSVVLAGSNAGDTQQVQMNFENLDDAQRDKVREWVENRGLRKNVFHAEMDFVKCLTDISYQLFNVSRENRNEVLRAEMAKLNNHIPNSAFMPTLNVPHRVLRTVPEEAFVFSTKERAPYLLVVEVSISKEGMVRERKKSEKGDRVTKKTEASDLGPGDSVMKKPSKRERKQSKQEDFYMAMSVHETGPNKPEERFDFKSSVLGQDQAAESVVVATENPDGISVAVGTAAVTFAAPPAIYGDVEYGEDENNTEHNMEDGDAPGANPVPDPTTTSGADPLVMKSFGEPWKEKARRLKQLSPYKDDPNWRLISVIVKARDQLRQEMFASRLIKFFFKVFRDAKLPLWLRPYEIIATGADCGFIETVADSKSLDSLKKNTPNFTNLRDYFKRKYGKGTGAYKLAVRNFVESMAGYSVLSYVLHFKDRHNGNLLLDSHGHLIHIDFGFLLSNSPGGNREFERAPFKLTSEMVDLMGGTRSGYYRLFRKLCQKGYLEICKQRNKLLLLVDLMIQGNEIMPCFVRGREYVLKNLSKRLTPNMTRAERKRHFRQLIDRAAGNFTTSGYDTFQYLSLGIKK